MSQLTDWLKTGKPELSAILLAEYQRLKTDVMRIAVYNHNKDVTNNTQAAWYILLL